MNVEEKGKRKRTGEIWGFALFFCFSTIWSALPLVLIKAGIWSLPPAQKVYMDSLSAMDFAVTLLIALANLGGAVTLFFLRKIAFHFFAAALAANVLLTAWKIATNGWEQTVGSAGIGSTLIGWAMLVGVCVYIWRLSKEDLLI